MYNHEMVEKKWQKYWEDNNSFEAITGDKKKPYYILVEFPYPSGAGLHVGHVRSYTAQDAIARMMRMQEYNVLYPMGWDAFGAPAEQYAIKNHIHPKEAVKENIHNITYILNMTYIMFHSFIISSALFFTYFIGSAPTTIFLHQLRFEHKKRTKPPFS